VKAPQLADRPLTTGRPPRRGLTLLLLASIIVSFLAAWSAPTPLYALYALALLASLLTFGKLSDHVGRRPVLLAALVLQALAMVQFATAARLGTLLGAGIVQGVATGTLPVLLFAVWAMAGFYGSLGPDESFAIQDRSTTGFANPSPRILESRDTSRLEGVSPCP